MKLSKKKINEINRVSFIEEIILEREGRNIGQTHWIDTPPDMWNKEERMQFDMLHENEIRLKESIINLLSN